MGLETVDENGNARIHQLREANPLGTDNKNQGDDHIRNIKKVIKDQFSGIASDTSSPSVVATATELNHLDGVTSNIQTQLNAKLESSGTIANATNAASATVLANARSIGLTGDVSGSATFNGSADISITATVADDSHSHVTGNIDGLDDALAGKLGTGATAADSNKVDGKHVAVVASMPASPDADTIYFVTG
jgi:hypothetical protein